MRKQRIHFPTVAPSTEIAQDHVLTVTDLSAALKTTLESQYQNVRVKGEVSGLKRHPSGHTYYVLKDKGAIIDAVCWRGHRGLILLEEGLEIIAEGRLTTYPSRSKYQLIVDQYTPAGRGALLHLFSERRKKLQAEGLFDEQRKKALPSFPRCIGLITSPTGAVIQDMWVRFQERFPCHLILWPVLVQGAEAAAQVAAAIEGCQTLSPSPDLLIVARGGGSLEDLWAFNEEIVVRAAAQSKIPLISAIGHETDTTLLDHVADVRAPTPTAAAEIAVPKLSDIRDKLKSNENRLHESLKYRYSHGESRMRELSERLPPKDRLIGERHASLQEWGNRLKNAYDREAQKHFFQITSLTERLNPPALLYEKKKEEYEGKIKELEKAMAAFLDKQKDILTGLFHRLEQASFHRVLAKGFALITTPEGIPIRSVREIPLKKPIQVVLSDGAVLLMRAAVGRIDPSAQKNPTHPLLFE